MLTFHFESVVSHRCQPEDCVFVLSQSWSRSSLSLVSGHESTMWDTVCCCPYLCRSDTDRPHLCKLAWHDPWSVLKRLSSDYGPLSSSTQHQNNQLFWILMWAPKMYCSPFHHVPILFSSILDTYSGTHYRLDALAEDQTAVSNYLNKLVK